MQAAKRHSSGGIRRLGQDRDFRELSVVLVRKSGQHAGGSLAPCGSLKNRSACGSLKKIGLFRLCGLHTMAANRATRVAPRGRRLRQTFDLTGDSIQSVIALEITKEAQIAGEVSGHARVGVTETGEAGRQASASSNRSVSPILDSFEYCRKCGWERGFPLWRRILPWRERTTTAVPVWAWPANPKLTETLLLFTFAMMHLLRPIGHKSTRNTNRSPNSLKRFQTVGHPESDFSDPHPFEGADMRAITSSGMGSPTLKTREPPKRFADSRVLLLVFRNPGWLFCVKNR